MSGDIARLGSGVSGSVFSIPEDPQHDVAGEPSQLLSPVAMASLGTASGEALGSLLVTAHRGASPGNLQVTAWALDETGSLFRTSQLAGILQPQFPSAR
jgi:hypothetical protein